MAQSYTGSFGTLIKPSSVVDQKVQTANGGLVTTGVLMLVGEADAGKDIQADDISTNYFGPDELAAVMAKYQGGPLVDAFRIAQAASNDPNIVGSFTRAYLAKTNVSVKASGSLTRSGLSAWATISDKSYGELGNLLNVSVTSTSEVAPTTGAFAYAPFYSASTSASLGLRVNGGSLLTVALASLETPVQVVTAVNALSGLLATGGVDRLVIGSTRVGDAATLALTVSGSSITVVISSTWEVTPTVGDSLVIGTGSAIGASNANRGGYVVTAASASSLTALKINVTGTLTPVTATDIVAATDLVCYSPVTIQNVTGTARAALTGLVGQLVTGTASGQTLTLTLATGQVWAAVPQVGDLVQIPSTAPAVWLAAGSANLGWYSVTASSSNVAAGGSTITMTRLSNGAPISFVATAIAAVGDLVVLRSEIDGTGKSLELLDNAGTEPVTSQIVTTAGAAVSFLSTALVPYLLTSTVEYASQVNVNRSADGVSEAHLGQGDVVLRIGYNGNKITSALTGTMTITGTTLTTTVTGGTGASLAAINLTKFKTLNDLVGYLNSQSGYVASVGSALFGQMALNYTDVNGVTQTVLDKGTFGIVSHLGAQPGRVKREAWALWYKISTQSAVVQLGTALSTAPLAGQPEDKVLFFLASGARGATTQAAVIAAMDKLEIVRGNFLVPLFSRNASVDIVDGLTDVSSTYDIDALNAYAKSHCNLMSIPKRRKYRQALVSKKTSFTEAKLAAQNLAAFRANMTFLDFKFVGTNGTITQFQPWAAAVNAAAMQAAGGYKGIVYKYANTSGSLMADGTYSDQILSQVEDALMNGLMPLERAPNGGFRWVSDQTTYGVDNNFVYNSLQAVYAMDTISLTIAERMENAFVGQSVADVGAGVVLAFLASIMSDLKRQKLVASSDDAPLGYRDATVKLNGPAVEISLNIKLAGSIYFIPVTAYFTQVSQTASQ